MNNLTSTFNRINWNKLWKQARPALLMLFGFLFFTTTGMAQEAVGDINLEGGQEALTEISGEVKGYFTPIVTFIYALAAIVAVFGIIRVYGKFQSGDGSALGAAAQWFGAMIFIVVAVSLVSSFFNIEE